MVLVKRLLTFLAVGALLGMIVASFVGPKFTVWYQTSSQPSAMCNCLETARDASDAVIRVQMIGAGIGAGVFLILGIILSVRGRGKMRPAEPSASSPGSAPPAV